MLKDCDPTGSACAACRPGSLSHWLGEMGCGASSVAAPYVVEASDSNKADTQTDSRSLFKAMMAEDIEMLATMLDGGVDMNATNGAGMTLLQVASERGKHKSRRFLRIRGASRFNAAERDWLQAVVNRSINFEEDHTIGEPIGSGGYANVYSGVRKGPGGTTSTVAVKLIR